MPVSAKELPCGEDLPTLVQPVRRRQARTCERQQGRVAGVVDDSSSAALPEFRAGRADLFVSLRLISERIATVSSALSDSVLSRIARFVSPQGRIMGAKSILPFRPTAAVRAAAPAEPPDRPATAAELEFVRARARQAARAFFEAELQDAAKPAEDRSCE